MPDYTMEITLFTLPHHSSAIEPYTKLMFSFINIGSTLCGFRCNAMPYQLRRFDVQKMLKYFYFRQLYAIEFVADV